MNLTTSLKSAVVSACLLGAASAANAAVVVDQSNIAVAPNGGSIIYQVFGSPINTNPIGTVPNLIQATGIQFVTAGISGVLSAVDLQMTRFGAGNLNGAFEVVIANNVTFDANGKILTGNVLGTTFGTVSSLSATGSIMNFDFSGLNISFNAGDQFAIGLRNPDTFSGAFGWAAGTSTDAPGVPFNVANFTPINYAGGNAYRGTNPYLGANPTFVPHVDFGFRTYVNSVPEPATWAMMIVGFGLVGGSMRRRHTLTVKFA
jgi:hypothetical protein